MKVVFRILAVVICSALTAEAGLNINVEAVKKSVVFIYGADTDAKINAQNPLGTGFLVAVPLISTPTQSYVFLVTARHIVDPVWAHCSQVNPSQIFMRLNKKSFDPEKDEIGTHDVPLLLLQGDKRNWFTSSDDQVDAAVLPLKAATLEDDDINPLPISSFPTPEEVKTFGVGDEIISAGLIPGASGKKRNSPFFKFGNISSIPNEPADAQCLHDSPIRSERVWFVAANLVPGNSGSPIFYVPFGAAGVYLGNGGRPVLLGVQSLSFIAWDVAGMTPIGYVYKIFEDMQINDGNLFRGTPVLSSPNSQGAPKS